MMGGMSRTNSAQKVAAQHDKIAAKKEKKEKKERKTGMMAKVKKAVNKNTQDYWTNGMNIHYSGVFARV